MRVETSIAVVYSREWCESMKDAVRLSRKKQMAASHLTACLRCLCMSFVISAAAFFTAGTLSAGLAQAQSATRSPATLRTLTKANEVHSLSTAESKRAFPVHLRAVVTYFDPSFGTETASMFVHDASGGVYVSLRAGIQEKLPPGTLIDVTGVSGPGGFAPIVDQAEVKVIGHAPFPSNPHRVTVTRLLTGEEDCQWVEVEGVVRSVFDHGHNIRMRLQLEGGIVTAVMVKEEGVSYSGLVASKVRIPQPPPRCSTRTAR